MLGSAGDISGGEHRVSEPLAIVAVTRELQGDSFEKNHPLLKLYSKFSSFGIWILISELP